MFADVMNMPVETVSAAETGALGCAIAVATALGHYDSPADAAAHMCAVSSAVYPRPEAVATYEKKYALYLRAIACLNDFWPAMQDLIERK